MPPAGHGRPPGCPKRPAGDRTQDGPEGPGRHQEAPGDTRRPKEVPGGPKRAQRSEPRRVQKVPGGLRRAPGFHRMPKTPPGGPWRAQNAGGHGPRCEGALDRPPSRSPPPPASDTLCSCSCRGEMKLPEDSVPAQNGHVPNDRIRALLALHKKKKR